MNRILVVILIVVTSLSFSSCKRNVIVGSGKQSVNIRNTAPFAGIVISASLNAVIVVKPGSACNVQLSGYDNLQSYIKTEVDGKTLRIFTPEDVDISSDTKVIATITVPSLVSLDLSGAPDAKVQGIITGDRFNLGISGAADVSVENLNVTRLITSLSGAGNITINSGIVTHAEYNISGAGSVKAFPLQTTETIADVSGAGECDVTVQKELNAHISGAGSIRYKGHPAVSSQTSGAGEVVDAN